MEIIIPSNYRVKIPHFVRTRIESLNLQITRTVTKTLNTVQLQNRLYRGHRNSEIIALANSLLSLNLIAVKRKSRSWHEITPLISSRVNELRTRAWLITSAIMCYRSERISTWPCINYTDDCTPSGTEDGKTNRRKIRKVQRRDRLNDTRACTKLNTKLSSLMRLWKNLNCAIPRWRRTN